jgi:hypothetical protein
MLGHRVNSEGLRGRAIARGGGAPKRGYIVFALSYCQPSGSENKPMDREKSAIPAGLGESGSAVLRQAKTHARNGN